MRSSRKFSFLAVLVCSSSQLLNAAPPASATVNVNFGQPLQAIQGFGASIPWVAGDLDKFSAADQTTILNALYSTTQPSAALSWVRVHTFMCQFNPSQGTYNFNDPLIQDQVSWANRVRTTYGVSNVWASNWTPPAWMKSGGSCAGGSLLPQYYAEYANVQVQWLQNWQMATGNAVNVLSLQNEPSTDVSYDSCTYTPDQINAATAVVRPALTNAGLTTKYTVPEGAVYGGTGFFNSTWATPILSYPGNPDLIDLMSTHGYGQLSNLSGPCTVCQQYGKEIWQTEVMSSKGRFDATMVDAQKWTSSIYQALNLGRFSAWFHWWVTYNANNTTPFTIVSIPKRVYGMGHFSRFMRPGSTLLTSTSTSTNLESTAAIPTSGKLALVLSNKSIGSINVTVNLTNASSPPTSVTPYRTSATENQTPLAAIPVTGGSFTITIPASSIVTVIG
jgi:glucuronoarabinoxylan endo-1,4-beta-xylanase